MNKHSLFTSNFKKNIIFFAKLLFALILICVYFNHVLPQFNQGYNAAIIEKVDRLESINTPKIVLVGNSNLVFGVNSKLIEENLGMPVVNMGLNALNGNAFNEEAAKLNVNSGDIYVLCHNSFGDNNTIKEPVSVWGTIENHYKLWKILRIQDVMIMMKSFPAYLKKCLMLYASGTGNQDPGGEYSRNAFNEYGDVAVDRIGSAYSFTKEVHPPKIGDVSVDRINSLNQYMTDRGASLVVASYPIANGNVTVNAEEFIDFQIELTDRLDCPVISNYVDYLYDYKYFYDTDVHLNSEGVKIRTNQLIYDLQRWIQSGQDATMDVDQHDDIVSDANLSKIENINDYLNILNNNKYRYTILISAKDDASSSITTEIKEKLQSLGLSADLQNLFRFSYVAIIERGNLIVEDAQNEKLEYSGFIDNDIPFSITSAGYDRGNESSILINEQEYSKNERGLNFVVYSNETHRIIDKVCFDTCISECIAIR